MQIADSHTDQSFFLKVRSPANTGDESSDKDVTDTEANKDNETGNTEPEDNAMDVIENETNKDDKPANWRWKQW